MNEESKNAWEHLTISINDKVIPAESVEYTQYMPECVTEKEDDTLIFELTPIEMSMLNRSINLKYVERSTFICYSRQGNVYSFKLGDFELKINLPPELDVKVGRNYKLSFIHEEAAE